jgi:hypothetical protein
MIVWSCLLMTLPALPLGCHRAHYRMRADDEVEAVMAEKLCDPRWDVGRIQLAPHPESRFYDPFSPDDPPKPPDDYGAYVLSPHPQDPDCVLRAPVETSGYLRHIEFATLQPDGSPAGPESGPILQTSLAEQTPGNGQPGLAPNFSYEGADDETKWMFSLGDPLQPPGTPTGLLDPANSYVLGLLNSREYQEQKENVYLAALDVTLERFAFAPQFFITQRLIYEHIGRRLPGGDPSTDAHEFFAIQPGPVGNFVEPGETQGSEAVDGQSVPSFIGPGPIPGNGIGFTKLCSTGGALLLRFANATVWEIAGPFEGVNSQSDIALELVQPLLQGGGKAVTLEALTQAERNLLYEIRRFARFQREFVASILTGADLDLASRLEDAQEADEDVDKTRRRVGFLPLVEQLQIVRNEQRNLVRLEAFEEQFEAFRNAGEVTLIQLDLVRQDVAQARSRVIRAQQRLYGNMDRFKLQLGIPTTLPVTIDERLLGLFELKTDNCELPELPIILPDFPHDEVESVQIAMDNRLDLMNARAGLVDHWRKVAVAANNLEGILDVQYRGEFISPDPRETSQPLNVFDRKRSRHSVALNTELPIVRKRERNIYRATLIEYQRARRRLMEFEDIVRLEVRGGLRNLIRSRQDFSIQRRAVILACRRVDQSRRFLSLPPPPGERRELGPTAARDLLQAQEDLVDAQNSLVGAWVEYQAAYLELLRDLELLDPNDPGILSHDRLPDATQSLDPAACEPHLVPTPSSPAEAVAN